MLGIVRPNRDKPMNRARRIAIIIDLPLRFILALIGFTFGGWIGWSGMVLNLLKVIGVIH